MSFHSSNSPDAVSHFFSNYLICLSKAGVPRKRVRWYVKHIETLIKAQKGRSIKTLTAADPGRYFDVLGRQKWLKRWQFCQHVDAIRILYCELFALPVCQDMDWSSLYDAARRLEDDHPTRARTLSPEELTYIKQRKGQGPLQQVRASHRDLLVRLASDIRQRGHVNRTESPNFYSTGSLAFFQPVMWPLSNCTCVKPCFSSAPLANTALGPCSQ